MNSIRSRLLLLLIVPLSFVAALVSMETFYSSRQISKDLNDRTLLAAMLTISENVIASNGTLLADAALQTLTENLGDQFFYHVRGPDGAFVTGYSGYPRPLGEIEPQEGVPIFYDGVHLGSTVRVVRMRQLLQNRELDGVTTITTWQKTTKRRDLTLELFSRSLIRLVLLVLAAGTIVWFAVSYGLRPIARLQSAIDQRTPYDLNPIRRRMPVELSGIVRSMNELFARVARSKRNRERFIGDAAHQLRNPIAAIKVQAQTGLDTNTKSAMQSGLSNIVEVADQSSVMVDKMLSGAVAHALDKDQQDKFDLSAMVVEICQATAPGAFDKDMELSLSADAGPISVVGNEVLLREALTNLIDNAIQHNDPKTNIEVALSQNSDHIILSVCDSGIMFSEEEFLLHTQPFFTGISPNPGSGLGLSIAKDIAKSHGGYLVSEAMENGGGKRISIVLPFN